MEINKIVIERLAFIRYLYNLAVEQSQRAEPLSSASVLTFHDAIELFLQLSAECLDAGKRDVKFMEYWDLLAPKLQGEGLTQKESVRRLNKARVALKHHGTRPSKLDIEAFRASATNFFEENTPMVFGISLSDISLIDLIQYEDAKNSLVEAQEKLKENKIEESLDKIAIAFAQLIDDYESRKRDEFGRSPFFFGRSLTFLDSFFIGVKGNLGDFIDNVKESVEAIQDAVKILSLGLDYRKYVKFRLLTPDILKMPNRRYDVQRIHRGSKGTPSSEDVQFCIDFVIESAIALQEFDFDLERVQTATIHDYM